MTEKTKILVTGGGGFLGRKIVDFLLKENFRVAVLGRRPYPDLEARGVETFQGDIADYQAVYKAAQGTEAIFHCAALAGIWGPEKSFFDTNVQGTANVIKSARTLGLKKIVHTSSPCVVHNGKNLDNINESQPYGENRNWPDHYQRTKIIAEKMILKANSPHLHTVALRPHLIWGPKDPHLLPRILEKADKKRLFKMSGGPYLVDVTYIDNAAWAHILAFKALGPGGKANGQAYFISQGEPKDLGYIIDCLLKAAGRPPVKKFINPKLAKAGAWVAENLWRFSPLPGEPPATRFVVSELSTSHWFNLTRAKNDLGYHPIVSFDEGLVRLADSF